MPGSGQAGGARDAEPTFAARRCAGGPNGAWLLAALGCGADLAGAAPAHLRYDGQCVWWQRHLTDTHPLTPVRHPVPPSALPLLLPPAPPAPLPCSPCSFTEQSVEPLEERPPPTHQPKPQRGEDAGSEDGSDAGSDAGSEQGSGSEQGGDDERYLDSEDEADWVCEEGWKHQGELTDGSSQPRERACLHCLCCRRASHPFAMLSSSILRAFLPQCPLWFSHSPARR